MECTLKVIEDLNVSHHSFVRFEQDLLISTKSGCVGGERQSMHCVIGWTVNPSPSTGCVLWDHHHDAILIRHLLPLQSMSVFVARSALIPVMTSLSGSWLILSFLLFRGRWIGTIGITVS